MNKYEDRVLHGLYHHRQMVGKEIVVTGNEILWLARHSLNEGSTWHKDNQFQAVHSDETGISRFKYVQADAERTLRYLADRKLIICNDVSATTDPLRIRVTGSGADRARRLHTWLGRRSQWYLDHKDGVAGLLITALLAIVVSLITNRIIRKP